MVKISFFLTLHYIKILKHTEKWEELYMNTNIHTMQILQLTFYYVCFLTQLPIYPSIIFYVFQYKLRPQYTSLLNTSFSMHINNYHSIYKFLIFEYNLPTKKYTNLKCKVFNKCTHCVTQTPIKQRTTPSQQKVPWCPFSSQPSTLR